MIANLKKLILRSFPGFPERYVSRIGEIVAVHDRLEEEQATDRFRPRYAVDVQPLTPQGAVDDARPVLEGLALPAFGVGDGRGLFAFPDVGARVRLGYDYGLPSHPYILQVLSEGRSLPALRPGEMVLQQGDDGSLRMDAAGMTLQTNGRLTLDCLDLEVLAEAVTESLGALTQTIRGDHAATVNGSQNMQVLGSAKRQVAGDVRDVVLGSAERTVLGDARDLVVMSWEALAGMDATLKSTIGSVLVESVAGSAELKSNIKASVTAALVDLGLTAAQAVVLGDAFLTLFNAHTHLDPVSGTSGPPITPMTPGTHTSLGVKTA